MRLALPEYVSILGHPGLPVTLPADGLQSSKLDIISVFKYLFSRNPLYSQLGYRGIKQGAKGGARPELKKTKKAKIMDGKTIAKSYANELFEDNARVRASNGSAAPKMAIYGFIIRDNKPYFAHHYVWVEGDPTDVGMIIEDTRAECRMQSGWYEDCTGWIIVRVNAHRNGVLVSTTLESAAIIRTENEE